MATSNWSPIYMYIVGIACISMSGFLFFVVVGKELREDLENYLKFTSEASSAVFNNVSHLLVNDPNVTSDDDIYDTVSYTVKTLNPELYPTDPVRNIRDLLSILIHRHGHLVSWETLEILQLQQKYVLGFRRKVSTETAISIFSASILLVVGCLFCCGAEAGSVRYAQPEEVLERLSDSQEQLNRDREQANRDRERAQSAERLREEQELKDLTLENQSEGACGYDPMPSTVLQETVL